MLIGTFEKFKKAVDNNLDEESKIFIFNNKCFRFSRLSEKNKHKNDGRISFKNNRLNY